MTGFQSKRASAQDKLKPTREEMIDYLSDSDFDYIMDGDGLGAELLDSYIRNGFKGYVSYTEAELKVEYEQRKELKDE
jgi:hypothetical protein